MKGSTTRLGVVIRTPNPDLNQVYEGEVPVEDQQTYQLQKYVGDGKAEVVVGRDMAAKDFGQGGGVFVSIKLTCNNDDGTIDYVTRCAGAIAQKHLLEQYSEHVRLLQNQGLIK